MKVLNGKRKVTLIVILAVALPLALAVSVTALPPVANDDAYTTNENTPLVVDAPGVLANDDDPDSDPLIAFLDTPPSNGELALNPDGGFVYTPTLDWNGVDTFSYLAADGDFAAVAHWPFDDGANPSADVSGNGYDAVLSGTVAFSTTVPVTLGAGLSLEFDGVNGSSDVQVNGIDLANQSFSVAAWARREPSGGNRYILTQGTPPGGNYHNLHVGFRDLGGQAYFTCAFWGDDLDTPQPYPDNDWHHWACTYDAGSNERTIYRDGLLVITDTAGADYQGSGPLHIGNTFGTVDCFPGLIDDVRIYNQPLSQPEIQTIMQGIPSADRATVNITVTGINEPPVPADDLYDVVVDSVLSVPAPGVLANDTDPDGDVLTATLLTPPTNGDLAFNLDGGFVYTPTPDFDGLDSFVYQASDGQFTENASVSLNVRLRRVTHSTTRADQPDIAIDANGNVHIAYTDEYTTSVRELWYTMLDNDGHTLIDDTRLTTDDSYESTRPAILVDSENKVHILWRDQRWDGGQYQEVTYTKLDPYLDDMDGGPAISGTITLIDDTRMSHNYEWYILSVRMALDSNGDIHIVWDNQDLDAIYYKKVDTNGDELVPETVIRSAGQWRATPYLALDSNGNLHLTWADYKNINWDEVYYMMLDNAGNILIDATRLTSDDDEYSKWSSLVVDADDKVHVVWQDDRGANKEIWYTKLDPDLDDQDGSPADEAAITLIPDTPLTPDDGVKSRHPVVAVDERMLHVTWEEDDDDNIHYSVLTNNGHFVLNNYGLTTNGTAYPSTNWTMPYLALDDNHRMHAVWCDSRDGTYEVYYTHYDWTYGQMDGHVYDAATLAPIEGATISAGVEAETDANGYYTTTTPVGAYTATAQHPAYNSAYQPNVAIITGSLTTLDWYLTARGRLYGYITDYDTGLPVRAAVNVLGYGNATSASDTGYYEIYVDAGTYDLEVTAPGYLTGTATVEVLSAQDTRQDFGLIYSLAVNPRPLQATLDWQTTASLPATLTNRLPFTYTFQFVEKELGFIPLLGEQPDDHVLAPPDVLVARADFDAEPLLSLLRAYGDLGAVDDMDVRTYTPVLADLLPYDVVITWSYKCYQDNEAMGDVLADYVDAGGQVINLMFGMKPEACYALGGRYWDQDYIALKASGRTNSTACLGAYDATHPIMAGVANACAYYRLTGSYLTPNSNEVAQFTDGSTFVAAKDDHSVVNLVAYMGGTLWSDQVPDMVHNAIWWEPGNVPWFGQVPNSGTVPAQSDLAITALFSATYAAGVDQPGDYSANLKLSGDPALVFPVRMTVLPPANMGKVEGYVWDRCLGEPVEASVHIAGGHPITETKAYPDGYYVAWLLEGLYELTFTAAGYLTHTASVSVTAGMTTTLDVDLFPDRACIQVEPEGFEVWLLSGTPVYTHPSGVDLANLGGQDLEFELVEFEGQYISPTLQDTVGEFAKWSMGCVYRTNDCHSHKSGNPNAALNARLRGHDGFGAYNDQFANNLLQEGVSISNPSSHILSSQVLLIQDTDPNNDTWHQIMTAYNIPFDVIQSYQIPNTDFAAYKIIAIPSVQGSTYNTNFNANLAQFEAFIDAGGIVLMSFCNYSHYIPYIQPPFGGTNNHGIVYDNYIESPSHPIFANVSNPYTGTYASSNYLSDLLPEDRVLVTQGTTPGGNAIMIERKHGRGLLLASGQTFEYSWGEDYDFGAILENMIFYYYFVYESDAAWLWEQPVSGTVPTDYSPLADLNVEIAFSTLYTDATPMPLGVYSATLFVLHNDPVTQLPMLPVTMHVVDQYVTPTASFVSDSPTCLGDSMAFTNTTSGGVPPASLFQWQFDDGVTSTLEHPSHVYGAVGTYTVSLTACSPAPYNLCDTCQDVVEVLAPPIAGFDYAVDFYTVQFTNTSQNTDAYLWTFGDGTTNTETHPVHTYATSDTFTVILEVNSACGTATFSDTVTTQAPPVCRQVTGVSLSHTNTSPIYPGTVVHVQANVTPDSFDPPYTYTIDYGDGTVLTDTGELDPLALSHSYAATGTYDAKISLWNCDMTQPVTDSLQVMVIEPGECVDLSGVALSLLTVGDIYPGDQVTLRADLAPAGASLPYTYTLDYGDDTTPVSDFSSANPYLFSHSYVATGTYTVTFEAWNCAMTQPASDTLQVVVTEPGPESYTVYLPLVLKND